MRDDVTTCEDDGHSLGSSSSDMPHKSLENKNKGEETTLRGQACEGQKRKLKNDRSRDRTGDLLR